MGRYLIQLGTIPFLPLSSVVTLASCLALQVETLGFQSDKIKNHMGFSLCTLQILKLLNLFFFFPPSSTLTLDIISTMYLKFILYLILYFAHWSFIYPMCSGYTVYAHCVTCFFN